MLLLHRTTRPVASALRQSGRSYHELTYKLPEGKLKYNSSYHYREPSESKPNGPIIAMLAAPWNPADAMVVSGTYPLSNTEPGFLVDGNIAGSEGWGQVVAVDSPSGLSAGDFVVPARPGMGTMRSHIANNSDFITLDRGEELFAKFGAFQPSALFQTGGTAYRMLKDFYTIQAGDTILQNGGNSAVGILASQMAATLFDAKPVSLVRRGKRNDEQNERLKQYLLSFGRNELVLFEEDLETKSALADALADHGLALPRLALNGVGGSSAQRMTAVLQESGVLVTYGGMSKKSFQASAAQLIFRDLQIVGYWQSRWMTQKSNCERHGLMNELVDMVLDGHVQLPQVKVFRLEDFTQGLGYDQSMEAIRRKVVFDCRE